jgi:hypothetical protein
MLEYKAQKERKVRVGTETTPKEASAIDWISIKEKFIP